MAILRKLLQRFITPKSGWNQGCLIRVFCRKWPDIKANPDAEQLLANVPWQNHPEESAFCHAPDSDKTEQNLDSIQSALKRFGILKYLTGSVGTSGGILASPPLNVT